MCTTKLTCSKKVIMEEVILRFPHLAKNIFEQVNFRSLANCSESSRLCREYLNEEEILQKSMIQEYTKCSKRYLKVIYYVRGIVNWLGAARSVPLTTVSKIFFSLLQLETKNHQKIIFWKEILYKRTCNSNLEPFCYVKENRKK